MMMMMTTNLMMSPIIIIAAGKFHLQMTPYHRPHHHLGA